MNNRKAPLCLQNSPYSLNEKWFIQPVFSVLPLLGATSILFQTFLHFILFKSSCNSFNTCFSRDLLFAISQKNCALKIREQRFPANVEEVKFCTLVINYSYVLLSANYLMSLMSIWTHPCPGSFRHQWGNLTHFFSGKSMYCPMFP